VGGPPAAPGAAPQARQDARAQVVESAAGDVPEVGGRLGQVSQHGLDALAVGRRGEQRGRLHLQLIAQLEHVPAGAPRGVSQSIKRSVTLWKCMRCWPAPWRGGRTRSSGWAVGAHVVLMSALLSAAARSAAWPASPPAAAPSPHCAATACTSRVAAGCARAPTAPQPPEPARSRARASTRTPRPAASRPGTAALTLSASVRRPDPRAGSLPYPDPTPQPRGAAARGGGAPSTARPGRRAGCWPAAC